MALNSLLNIGSSALAATQTAINVTGGNIANVNTDGYCRQAARFEELQPLDFHAGQLGQGVKANEIMRYFNRFVEDSFLDKSTDFNRWSEQSTVLGSVESLFNEANRKGISSAMGAFFNDWQDLSLRPNDMATREALLGNATTLTNLIRDTKASLENTQREMDMYIKQGVRDVNDLIDSIQEINKHISAQDVPGVSNANGLKDERDRKVRELAELIDIKVEDKGGSNFTIRTKNGSVLLDANTKFSLTTATERIENNLIKGSAYKGSLEVTGNDSNEYTFQVETPPTAGVPGQMKVSFDGGRTWLKNEDGTTMMVEVPSVAGQTVRVKDLDVSFNADPTELSAGDRFEVVPKEGLYWVSPTRPPLNVTPQTLSDGTENTNRLTGGKIAAYYNVRDQNVGRYMDKLDGLAKSLVWEVNNLHAQGAGTTTMTNILGTYKVGNLDLPLGVSGSGLPFSDRLTEGNLSIQIYDKDGKPLDMSPLQNPPPLDFDMGTPGIQNFDPSVHSMNDVVDAINNTYRDAGGNQLLTASVIDGKLQLSSAPETSFTVANDTSGLLAGLGLNTFFKGSSASDIALNDTVVQNTGYINAGKLNASGEVNTGDPATAKALGELATKSVKISSGWDTTSNQSLGEYYGSLVGTVGSEARSANTAASYNKALALDLDKRSSAISGVNLDEEMTSLIKFQHSYTAAAKLITTADQMMQTLLGLKQ